MKKKTIAALAAGGALLLAAVVIGVLSLVRGYFILLPPTHMQLNGRTEEHIAAFSAYTDPGARLLRGGDPTDAAVTVEGRVNTDVPGDYTLTYQANFRGRSYTAKRLVHVEDREAPELSLTGQAEVTVSRYDLFQDPGATARDRCDGDLTASIQVTDKASGDVHTLTYTVTDKAGNAATATRRVTVRDIVAPVITLSGQRELFVPLGGAYQEPGFTAQDDADGDLTASVTRAGTVNTASPGVYTLTYTVTDKAGNTATATRQVSVYENSSGGSPVYLTFDDGPSDRVTPRVLDRSVELLRQLQWREVRRCFRTQGAGYPGPVCSGRRSVRLPLCESHSRNRSSGRGQRQAHRPRRQQRHRDPDHHRQ